MIGLKKVTFLIYAAILAMIGFWSSDMYLPALTEIQMDLNTTAILVGMSISIYMIGFALAQLIYGPLSDQIGRKKTLLIGLILFFIASIGCFFATSIYQLLGFRLLQALGICAAFVVWQPMIIDLFPKKDVRKIFTLLVALLGLSPALGPLTGGFVAEYLGWRTVFLSLVIVAAVLLLWTSLVFKESLPQSDRKQKFDFKELLSNYRMLARSRVFWGIALAIALNESLYFTYVAIVPFNFAGLGYSTKQIGMTYLPVALAFMAGSFISRSLVERFGELPILCSGIIIAMLSSFIFWLISVVFPFTNIWQAIIPFIIINFSNGLIVPTGMVLLLQRYAKIAGTCASGMGFLQSFLAFLTIAIASLLIGFGLHGMTSVILVSAVLMVFAYWFGASSLKAELHKPGLLKSIS